MVHADSLEGIAWGGNNRRRASGQNAMLFLGSEPCCARLAPLDRSVDPFSDAEALLYRLDDSPQERWRRVNRMAEDEPGLYVGLVSENHLDVGGIGFAAKVTDAISIADTNRSYGATIALGSVLGARALGSVSVLSLVVALFSDSQPA